MRELLLLARLDALVVWDLQYSTYSAVAASWFQHGGGGQAADAASRHNEPWRAVFRAAQGCKRLEPWQVEPGLQSQFGGGWGNLAPQEGPRPVSRFI